MALICVFFAEVAMKIIMKWMRYSEDGMQTCITDQVTELNYMQMSPYIEPVCLISLIS